MDIDFMALEGSEQVEAAALGEVGEESVNDRLPSAGTLEAVVMLVESLPGGGFCGQVIPGEAAGEFLEDELEDEAIVEGGAAAGSRREEGLEKGPLEVGEEGRHGESGAIFLEVGIFNKKTRIRNKTIPF